MSPNLLPLLEQLGLKDVIFRNSMKVVEGFVWDENLKVLMRMDHSGTESRYGHFTRVIARPKLVEILASHVPEHKLHRGKRVLSTAPIFDNLANPDAPTGVTVTCADNTKYSGDIVVGADGVYSAVRQSMLERIEPNASQPEDKASACDENFRCSDWGPEMVDAMIKDVRDFPVPCGKNVTMGDLIEASVKDDISKVMLEEKMFETWHFGRTVLMGDACHKMNPSAGSGAVMAIQDAAVLADLFYHLKSNSLGDITRAFETFREVRFPPAKKAFNTSHEMSQLTEQSWINDLKRWLANYMPKFFWHMVYDGLYLDQYQVSFLPQVPLRGYMKPIAHESMHMALSQDIRDSSKLKAFVGLPGINSWLTMMKFTLVTFASAAVALLVTLVELSTAVPEVSFTVPGLNDKAQVTSYCNAGTTLASMPTAAQSAPYSVPSISAHSERLPHVLIIGGGIGGLTLSILLEHARISYTVLERSASVRLLGSAIALGPGVLPLFEQLGLLEEIEKHSRPVSRGMVWSEKLVPIMDLDHRSTEKRYGFLTRVISRPKLYQILLSKVPAKKIHKGKKVVSMTQESEARKVHQSDQHPYPVSVTCANGSQFFGDIVVGADGAYSATRHLLYQQIEDDSAAAFASNTASTTSPEESLMIEPLPASDKEVLSFTSTCLVGQTGAGLDRKKFNFVHGADCRVGSIIGDNKPFSWSVFSMPDDSICWMVTEHLNETLPSPAVTTILSTSRPASPLSQVAEMHPSAGLGAVAAIQDAAVLSDLLFHLPVRASLQDITNAFRSYREDRYPIAQQSYEARYQMSHLNEQSWISNFIRKVMNNLPKWIWYRALDRLYEYRPQVSFLPKVDDRGEVPPLPQSYYYCP
ncbi:hypothetical protein KVV02_003257 [Mortierella alpina]|uniref:FAD-binding domain-containing protein n=1 Tax=Mortierella alpina TaxID=64518 RepID=A0A9P7ZWV1_MORAP|nr:hypothetical protein KVV02_003257 [Mortierella alpina]